MTSAKFGDFLNPSPPCPQNHATSLTTSSFGLTPSPLSADVIYGCPLIRTTAISLRLILEFGRKAINVS